jgi:hypothetical protein
MRFDSLTMLILYQDREELGVEQNTTRVPE